MGARVRRVRSYTRGGRQAGRVRGYTTHGGGFNKRPLKGGLAKLSRNAARVKAGGRANTRSGPNKTRRRTPGVATARGNELRHGRAVMRSKSRSHRGASSLSDSTLRRGRQPTMKKSKSPASRSIKKSGRAIKQPSAGKTRRHVTGTGKSNLTGKKTGKRKVSQTKASKKPPNRTARNAEPIPDMHQIIRQHAAQMPKGPRGVAVGNKGVVRIGPDLRTAEQKRNPRRVRKH